MSVEPESSERQGADIRLVALYRNARQPVRELTRSLTLLGRGRDCDIVLASDSVGTAHAAIVRLGNAAYVCDLGAPAGTVVNGRAIRWEKLSDGNDLILGRFRFRIELGESTLEPTGECPVFTLTSDASGTASTGRAPVLIVGSAEGCDIRLVSRDVSPRHCMVVWTQHGPVVRDLGSETGTRHNGRAVTLGRLLGGDTIDVGPHALTFAIQTKVDEKETSAAPSGDRLVPSSAAESPAAIISGRLDRERVPALDELWPSPERLDAAASFHTETARDLRLLDKASDRIAATDAGVKDADDEASALAALSRGSLAREQQGRQEMDFSVLAARAEKSEVFGGSAQGVTTVVAQAVHSGQARVSRGRSAGTAIADTSDAARIRERILKQAAELQRRRDIDRGRTLMPPTGLGPAAVPSSLGPADEPSRGISSRPRGLDADVPPSRPDELSRAAADASAKALADLREQAARERAEIDRLTREVIEREEMWQRRSAKLEMELAQARDEARVTTQKLARHLELHGTVEARKRKLDQRVTELRERVAGAQEALDERARKIRAGLEQERERLRLRRTEIREQARKLEESLCSRREEIERELADRTAALESEREEIRAAGETLKRREEQFETQQAALEQRQQELNDAFRTKEAEREAEHEALRQDWQERQHAVEEAGQAAIERQEAALAKRLAELEERGRAELERKTAELEQRLNARHAELDLEAAAAESEYQAKLTALGQREADLDRVRDELDVRDATVVEREVELTDREQVLLKQAEQIEQRQDELARRSAEAEDREEHLRQSEESVAAERRRIEVDRESVEVERNQIAQRRDDLDRRAKGLETRFAELASGCERLKHERETIESRRAELDVRDATVVEREVELTDREQALLKQAEQIEQRQDELARRSAEAEGREEHLRQSEESVDAERRRIEVDRESVEAERNEIAQRREDLDRRAEELETRFAELAGGRETMESRRAELDVRDATVVERELEMTDREQALLKQAEQIEQRQDDLARRIAEAKRCEERLRQSEESVEAERNQIAQRREDLDRRAEELETRFAELAAGRERLERERATIESRRAELEGREAALASREEAVEHRQHELDIEATRLAEAKEAFRNLEEQAHELDRRDMELAAREDALNERVSAYEHEVDGLERSRDDIDGFRARQTAERRELEGRAALLDERLARAEEMERRAREAKAEQESDREELDDLHASNEARAAQLEVRHQDLSRRMTELEEAEVALQLDREKLLEQEQTVAREKTELQRAKDRLDSDLSGLELARARLADESGIIERTREEIASKGAAIEADRARLERDRLAVRDRERELSEQRTRLEAATQEADQTKADLERRIAENEDLRRELAEKADRARACEERLAREASALDERGRVLDRELEDVRHTRHGLDRDRESLEEERCALETERRRLGEEQVELSQSRLTFQAGMRELEHREANHAEREAELAERVKQLEAYRERLEEEYAELDRQRQDLASAHVSDSASSEKLSILMEQAEASRNELRAREEEDYAHQQALAARAAELAAAEEELRQRTESLDERTRELDASREALASERDEFESVMASEREHVESLRHEAEAELAAERETLERRSSELEADYVARLRELESQGATRDKEYISELRRKIEEDHAKRSAELRGKEEEVERRCRQRLDEVEKDIQQRLAELEDQIRQRGEQAERELAEREAALDSDMTDGRERLDAEVQDLQRRQALLAEEQARLRETRNQLETERDAFQSERLALVTEDEPADGPTAAEEAQIDSAVLAGRAADLEAHQARLDARARVIREAYDELKQLRLRASVGDAGGFDGGEVGTESLDRLQELESDSTGLEADDIGGPIVLPDDFAQGEPVPAAAGVLDTAAAESGPDPLPRESVRRFPLARTLLLAVMFGIAVGAVYLMWSARQDVEVAGELALQNADSAAAMSAGAHLDRLLAILPAASAKADADLAELHRRGKISVRQSESALELVAVVSPSERAAARGWIDAIGETYVASLGREPDSEADVQERLAELQAARAGTVRKLDGIRHEIEVMQVELAGDPRLGDTEKTGQEKARTKAALEQAMADRDAARAALETLQQTPPTAGPITPTEGERKAAYQSDRELAQDMDQLAARAVEFHDVLTGAMSSTQGPLAGHQTTIDAFISHVEGRLKSQTDPDISKELEQIAVRLQDYRDESRRFTAGWDELAPKVAGWTRGGDAEALLEYQRQAEDLVRSFDKATKASLGSVVKAYEDLGSRGTEMTQRRIIESRLRTLAHGCSEARRALLEQAIGVVPANNAELRTLRRTIRDLMRRIKQRQGQHDLALADHLAKRRADEYQADLAAARQALEAATRRWKQANSEFLTVDEAMTKDEEIAAEFEQRRQEIADRARRSDALETRIDQIDAEIARVRAKHTISTAGAASYRAVEGGRAALLDPQRLRVAGVLAFSACGCALLLIGAVWFGVRLPGRGPRPESA